MGIAGAGAELIPVLICPVINRFDLLERMVRSIRGSVERFVIVECSCSGYSLPSEFDDLDVVYIRPPLVSLGYGGGINAGIIQTAGAPWWAFTNADIVFGPEDPPEIERLMNETQNPRMVTYGFAWGAINPATIDRVGLIDDWTFFPIYFDDNDYSRRCLLGGVEIINYKGGIVHGAKEDGDGSVTIKSSDQYREGNNRTFPVNYNKYLEKWGGPPGWETFTTPWNSGYPLWYTKPDITGKHSRNW